MSKHKGNASPSDKPDGKKPGREKKNPYNFVPVKPEQAITCTPVWHDTLIADDGQTLHSGELRCTMTTLTPLLAGNYQYKLSEAENWGNVLIDQGYLQDKTVVEPLRLAAGSQPVIISGSALKGMLRGTIAALASAPMERVAEQTYSYRPNAVVEKDSDIKALPAVPVERCADGSIIVRVLPTLQSVYFVKRVAEDAQLLKDSQDSGADFEIPAGYGIKNNQFRKGVSNQTKQGPFRVFKYYGGLDGKGMLAKDGSETFNYVIVGKNEWCGPAKDMKIPKELWEHFRKNTLDHLKNTDTGHISSRHSGLHKKSAGDIHEIAKGIENLQSIFERDPHPDGRILIYLETLAGQATSVGHHFRYRWRYRDSIHYRNTGQNHKLRRELIPLEEEKLPPPELKLSLARLLFGFVSNAEDDNGEPGCRGLGGGKVPSLAGRVAINAAVEDVAAEDTDEQRFLKANDNYNVFLKILGAPKASAVEHYLTQDTGMLSKRKDQGTLCTYGDTSDDPSSGGLRGRKLYYHQPQAASDLKLYTQDRVERECAEDDTKKKNQKLPLVIQGKQCAIGRFVSVPGRQFRFTIRFRNLRDFELGLLMYVIELDADRTAKIARESKDSELDRYVQDVRTAAAPDKPAFAHKLGHGRPLGLGSVRLTINELWLLDRDGNLSKSSNNHSFDPVRLVAGGKMNEWIRGVFFPWLRMHQFAGMEREQFGYPEMEPKDKSPIINFHNQMRMEHLKGRKKRGKEKVDSRNPLVLPDPLDDISTAED
ncbi:MAG TPA: TIGR03986 family CRISPR-associated RAMP protein [Kiritimatiellia bacterium]|nr:TIGR03986 family CRISPR-associated RAMP protein [Kiritimatiellia bacterium]